MTFERSELGVAGEVAPSPTAADGRRHTFVAEDDVAVPRTVTSTERAHSLGELLADTPIMNALVRRAALGAKRPPPRVRRCLWPSRATRA